MIVAVASGKGGTGKTTVAVNLAKALDEPVRLLDCDVEAPNAHLFLNGTKTREEVVNVPVPQVNPELCDSCGECSRFCQYHAIVSLKNRPLIFPELCHGCGGCVRVCSRGALREIDRRIGVIESFDLEDVSLIHGRLDVGVPMAVPLIRTLKRHIQPDSVTIIDAPPGTSCPVVSAVRGADLVLLVTEPTPFGLHDLRLAVEMMREIRLPFGVVINRVGIGDRRVHAFCHHEHIPVFLEIPDDRRIAEAYSRGELIVEALPEYRDTFERLARQVMEQMRTKSEVWQLVNER